jgi:hypothetical protein
MGTEVRSKTWAVTVTDVQRGAKAATAIKKANQFNDPPKKGFDYVLVTLKATNISTEKKAQDPSFGVDIRLTGDRQVLYSRVAAVSPKQFKGDLLPKGSAEGQVVFSVPTDEKNLMFRVGDSFSFDENAYRFVATDLDAKLAPPADLAAITATDAGAAKESPAKINVAVFAGPYQVTILEVLRGKDAAAKIKAANQFNEPAPAGREYIALRVHVRYLGEGKSDSTASINNSLFKVSGEKNVVYDHVAIVAPPPQLDETVFPGGEAEGWIALAVDSGEKGLMIIIEPVLSFSDGVARYVTVP